MLCGLGIAEFAETPDRHTSYIIGVVVSRELEQCREDPFVCHSDSTKRASRCLADIGYRIPQQSGYGSGSTGRAQQTQLRRGRCAKDDEAEAARVLQLADQLIDPAFAGEAPNPLVFGGGLLASDEDLLHSDRAIADASTHAWASVCARAFVQPVPLLRRRRDGR